MMAVATKPPDPKFVLRGSKYPITSLCFIENIGLFEPIKYLSVGSQDGTLSLWNLEAKTNSEWKVSSSSILWQQYSSKNLWLCSRNDAITVWDIERGEDGCINKFELEDYIGFSQCDLIDSENWSLLAVPGPSQECVTVWDVKSKLKVCSIDQPTDGVPYGSVMQVKWIEHENSPKLSVLYENGELCLWDWSNRSLLSKIEFKENPLSIAYNNSTQEGLCGTATEKIFSFKLESTKLNTNGNFSIINPGINCIASRNDNKIFATGGWDHRVRIFSWKRQKPLAVLNYHNQSIECIKFSSGPVNSLTDGFLLAAGSSDKMVSLWDIYN